MWGAARLAVQFFNRNGSLSVGPQDIDLCIERHEGNRPVTWVDGNASVAATEQRMTAIDAVVRGAAGPWLAFVARKRFTATEVSAARALQQVAAQARHVSKLLRSRLSERLGEGRIFGRKFAVGSYVAHPRQGAEHQLTRAGRVELAQPR